MFDGIMRGLANATTFDTDVLSEEEQETILQNQMNVEDWPATCNKKGARDKHNYASMTFAWVPAAQYSYKRMCNCDHPYCVRYHCGDIKEFCFFYYQHEDNAALEKCKIARNYCKKCFKKEWERCKVAAGAHNGRPAGTPHQVLEKKMSKNIMLSFPESKRANLVWKEASLTESDDEPEYSDVLRGEVTLPPIDDGVEYALGTDGQTVVMPPVPSVSGPVASDATTATTDDITVADILPNIEPCVYRNVRGKGKAKQIPKKVAKQHCANFKKAKKKYSETEKEIVMELAKKLDNNDSKSLKLKILKVNGFVTAVSALAGMQHDA